MFGIALDLGGAAHVAFDQNALRGAVGGKHGREIDGLARDEHLGSLGVGNDRFGGLAGARGRESGEGDGRAHQLKELAAAFRIGEFGRLLGELAVKPDLDVFGVG